MPKSRLTERPILFSGAMIQAILANTKTQTRRVIKPQPVVNGQSTELVNEAWQSGFIPVKCPYGEVGDGLWCRETGWQPCYPSLRQWRDGADTWPKYAYDADGISENEADDFKAWGWKRRPSIFMPRKYSRITLAITGVRVERLNEISREDAIAEGIQVLPLQSADDPSAWWQSSPGVHQERTPQASYRALWNSINGADSWRLNPWVWVVTFKRIEGTK